jgi:hypothetical protein
MTRFVFDYPPHSSNGDKNSVTDNSGSFDCDVVTRDGDVVHDRWVYPHPSSIGRGVNLDKDNSGSPDRLNGAHYLRVVPGGWTGTYFCRALRNGCTTPSAAALTLRTDMSAATDFVP